MGEEGAQLRGSVDEMRERGYDRDYEGNFHDGINDYEPSERFLEKAPWDQDLVDWFRDRLSET